MLLALIAGCTPSNDMLPTLAPTLSQATDMPPTSAPTLDPPTTAPSSTSTASSSPTDPPPALTFTPTDPPLTSTPVVIVTPTVPPPHVVNNAGALTITLTGPQLNQALIMQYVQAPLSGFSRVPQATLIDGGLRLALTLNAAAAPVTLTLTLAALPTAAGSQLDVRAVALSMLKGVTTLQVKPAQALLTTTLNAIMIQAADSDQFNVTSVTVTAQMITLTIVTR